MKNRHFKQKPYNQVHAKPSLQTMVAQVIQDSVHSWYKQNYDFSSYGWLQSSNKKELVDSVIEYGKAKLLLKKGKTIGSKEMHDVWRKKHPKHKYDIEYDELPAYIKMRYVLFRSIVEDLMTVGELLSDEEKSAIQEKRNESKPIVESTRPISIDEAKDPPKKEPSVVYEQIKPEDMHPYTKPDMSELDKWVNSDESKNTSAKVQILDISDVDKDEKGLSSRDVSVDNLPQEWRPIKKEDMRPYVNPYIPTTDGQKHGDSKPKSKTAKVGRKKI